MKNLYIIILISLIIFIVYITRNKREYFTKHNIKINNTKINNTKINNTKINNTKTLILLGDSVLNNNSYVEKGKAVNELLRQKIDKNTNIVSLAINDSTINSIYPQLEKVNTDLNDELTTVFLSVGGNDIIKMREKNIDHIFKKYNTLVDAIKTKLPNVKLVLLNIYYPTNRAKSHSMIEKWNHNMDLKYKRNNKNIHILNLAKLLKEPSDFVYDIEPSITGGEKIANKISTM
jgi:lysophospholipase L1-like esterase